MKDNVHTYDKHMHIHLEMHFTCKTGSGIIQWITVQINQISEIMKTSTSDFTDSVTSNEFSSLSSNIYMKTLAIARNRNKKQPGNKHMGMHTHNCT